MPDARGGAAPPRPPARVSLWASRARAQSSWSQAAGCQASAPRGPAPRGALAAAWGTWAGVTIAQGIVVMPRRIAVAIGPRTQGLRQRWLQSRRATTPKHGATTGWYTTGSES